MAIATITDNEDALIGAVEALKTADDKKLFAIVESIGRRDAPAPLAFPAAYIYFLFDRRAQGAPRPVYDRNFEILILNKNLRGERQAAQDTYALIEAARDAVIGKDFSLVGMSRFECTGIQIVDYEGGVIAYTLGLTAKAYLPVPGTN